MGRSSIFPRWKARWFLLRTQPAYEERQPVTSHRWTNSARSTEINWWFCHSHPTSLATRKTLTALRFSTPWSTSGLEMGLSQNASCLTRFLWMGRVNTRCSPGWRVRCPSPQTTGSAWWPTQSSSSGNQSSGRISLGTLKSSWWTNRENHSSATPKSSRPATSPPTSTSCFRPHHQNRASSKTPTIWAVIKKHLPFATKNCHPDGSWCHFEIDIGLHLVLLFFYRKMSDERIMPFIRFRTISSKMFWNFCREILEAKI